MRPARTLTFDRSVRERIKPAFHPPTIPRHNVGPPDGHLEQPCAKAHGKAVPFSSSTDSI